jgi:threonine/homoserine/homoserine lactone efflux protein
MLTAAQWSVFLTATIVLLIVPGPSVIYVLTQAVEHGRRGALLASLGLALGDFAQAAITAAGLAALLASSMVAFHAVKYAGAAYLLFLGLKRFRNSDLSLTRDEGVGAIGAGSGRLVVQAFLTLNPKTTLFFFALFPQVIDVHATDAWLHMLLLGAVFAIFGLCTNFLFGFIGRSVVVRFAGRDLGPSARYVTGIALIGLGIIAAVGK